MVAQSSLADRARNAYQQAISSGGRNMAALARQAQETNRALLVELLEKLLGISIAPDGIYFNRFDSIRPHAYIDGMEFTAQFVPVYHRTVLQLVQRCEFCKEEKLSIIASLAELGSALEGGANHLVCRRDEEENGRQAQGVADEG